MKALRPTVLALCMAAVGCAHRDAPVHETARADAAVTRLDAGEPRVLRVVDVRVVAAMDGALLLVVGGEQVARSTIAPVPADLDAGTHRAHESAVEMQAERALAEVAQGDLLAVLHGALPAHPVAGALPEPVRGTTVRVFAWNGDSLVALPAPPSATNWYPFDESSEPLVVASDPPTRESTFAWTNGAWTLATAPTFAALALRGVPGETTVFARGTQRDAVTMRCAVRRQGRVVSHVGCRPERVPLPLETADAGVRPVRDAGAVAFETPGGGRASGTGAVFLLRDACEMHASTSACRLEGVVAPAGGPFRTVQFAPRYEDLDASAALVHGLAVEGEEAVTAFVRAGGRDESAWSLEAWQWSASARPARIAAEVARASGDDEAPRVIAARVTPPAVLWTTEHALVASELRDDGTWHGARIAIDGVAAGRFTREGAVAVVARAGAGAALTLLRATHDAWSAPVAFAP